MITGMNNKRPVTPVLRLGRAKIRGEHRRTTHRSLSGLSIRKKMSMKIIDGQNLYHDMLWIGRLDLRYRSG